jgi:hypothetical protein
MSSGCLAIDSVAIGDVADDSMVGEGMARDSMAIDGVAETAWLPMAVYGLVGNDMVFIGSTMSAFSVVVSLVMTC